MCNHDTAGLQKPASAAEVEQQLDRLIESFERVDWRRVNGVSTSEAAALGERLRNAEASR
jgi:hypothetical protein